MGLKSDFSLRSALCALVSIYNSLLLLIEKLVTVAVDVKPVVRRNVANMSAAPHSENGVGSRSVSSSPVMVAKGIGPQEVGVAFVINLFVEIFSKKIPENL